MPVGQGHSSSGLTRDAIERQAAGPGQTTPVRFKQPVWPAPGIGPWPMVPPVDQVPPPNPPPRMGPAIERQGDAAEEVDEHTAGHAQDIIAANESSRERLELLAEVADEPKIASLLDNLAGQRAAFIRTLEPHAIARVERGARARSTHRSVQRWWLIAKKRVGTLDDRRVLREAERGERELEEAYNDALADLPRGELRALVLDQRETLLIAHRRVMSMLR